MAHWVAWGFVMGAVLLSGGGVLILFGGGAEGNRFPLGLAASGLALLAAAAMMVGAMHAFA